jgi:hypothetical protein
MPGLMKLENGTLRASMNFAACTLHLEAFYSKVSPLRSSLPFGLQVAGVPFCFLRGKSKKNMPACPHARIL